MRRLRFLAWGSQPRASVSKRSVASRAREERSAPKHCESEETRMRTVAIESPYAGDIPQNVRYAKACVRDCLKRNEACYGSHLFFTQEGLLDDNVPEERKLGMQAGFFIAEKMAVRVVYEDLGYSSGMRAGMNHAMEMGQAVEFRKLGEGWDK